MGGGKDDADIGSEKPAAKLGALIRRIRKERGITCVDLSEKSGVAANYIAMVERGLCDVSLSRIKAIANGLGMKTSELMGRLGESGWTEEMEEIAARYEGASGSQRMIAVAMLAEVFPEMRRRMGIR